MYPRSYFLEDLAQNLLPQMPDNMTQYNVGQSVAIGEYKEFD